MHKHLLRVFGFRKHFVNIFNEFFKIFVLKKSFTGVNSPYSSVRLASSLRDLSDLPLEDEILLPNLNRPQTSSSAFTNITPMCSCKINSSRVHKPQQNNDETNSDLEQIIQLITGEQTTLTESNLKRAKSANPKLIIRRTNKIVEPQETIGLEN